MDCPYCGADNREKAKFCRLCAKRLDKRETEAVSQDTKSAINKSSTSVSKKIVFITIPALIAAGIGGWLFTNHNEVKESKVKSAKTILATPTVQPTTVVTTTASDSSTTASSDSTIAKASNEIISDKSPTATEKTANSTAPMLEANSSIADEKSITPSSIERPIKPQASQQLASNSNENQKTKKSAKPVEKKETNKANAKAKVNSNEVAPTKSTVAQPSPQQYQAPKQPPKSSFASELEACKNKPFFAKASCENQVQYKYCAGKSGSSPECPSPRSSDPSDGRG